MSLSPSDLQRALDALAVLGTFDAAATAAGCGKAELLSALRSLVPAESSKVGAPTDPGASRSRRRVTRADDDQPSLLGLAGDPDAAHVPEPESKNVASRRIGRRAASATAPSTPAASAPAASAPAASAPAASAPAASAPAASALAASAPTRSVPAVDEPRAPRLAVVPSPPVLHIDAGSRGNPGPAACAFVAKVGEAEEIHGKFLGRQTNNEAEYAGLLEALRWLKTTGHHGARLHMDSQLVVMQVNGAWKVREPRLQVLASEARTLLATTRSSLHHVMREKNREADREVNRVLDEEAAKI